MFKSKTIARVLSDMTESGIRKVGHNVSDTVGVRIDTMIGLGSSVKGAGKHMFTEVGGRPLDNLLSGQILPYTMKWKYAIPGLIAPIAIGGAMGVGSSPTTQETLQSNNYEFTNIPGTISQSRQIDYMNADGDLAFALHNKRR